MIKRTLAVVLGAALTLVLLEFFFQAAPVFSGLRIEQSNDAQPFIRALPHQPYVFSHNWAMINVQRSVTNAQGFSNSEDFKPNARALVIGDSFIEAHMLAYPQTVQGVLAQSVGGGVYAAAASGNGLADYLQVARYYVPRLQPRNLVVFLKESDLAGMLARPDRGHSTFVVDGGQVQVVHEPYVESHLKQQLARSALLRYVYYNLKARELFAKTEVGALSVKANPAALAQAQHQRQAVLDYYFQQLQALARTHAMRVILLVDGDRKAIYAGHDGAWKTENLDSVIALARRYGFAVADTRPVFRQRWLAAHERFDYLPEDGHWNALAHRLAAQQVLPLLAP